MPDIATKPQIRKYFDFKGGSRFRHIHCDRTNESCKNIAEKMFVVEG